MLVLLAGLLGSSSTAIAADVIGNPCENVDSVNGSSVTLPNNQVVECSGNTVANPAPAGSRATVTNPPQPMDPIRDNPGTSVDRIRGAYGGGTGTTGTVGRTGIGDTVGVPDSTGVVRGTDTRGAVGVTDTDTDSRAGVTTGDLPDSTLGTTGTTGTTGTMGGSGSVGGTGTSSTGTVGGTGTGTAGSTGASGTGAAGGGAR